MSYTFTSPIKNYNNKESLNHCSEVKKKVNNFFEESKTILMVGWRHDSDNTFLQHMLDCDKKITIVEVFPKNYESIPRHENITPILSDIRDYIVDKNYDLFLWAHGPEHVQKTDVSIFLNKYQNKFKNIILESPNGHCAQDVSPYGNPYEEHTSSWSSQDYQDLGFETILYAGQTNDVFIIAYKINENSISS